MAKRRKLEGDVEIGPDGLRAFLVGRRSERSFSRDKALAIPDILDVLWAMQGVGDADGHRTVPSAGGIHPLALSAALFDARELPPGVYDFNPDGASLECLAEVALSGGEFVEHCYGPSEWVADASALILASADFRLVQSAFGDQPPEGRADRYVWMETGCSLQAAMMSTAALGLSSCIVGGFDDDKIAGLFRLPRERRPLAMLALGNKRK